jgi:hypothetical protein
MNTDQKRLLTGAAIIILLAVGVIAYNERNQSYQRAVEKMHHETARRKVSNELPKVTQPLRWTDENPTNTPICVSVEGSSN